MTAKTLNALTRKELAAMARRKRIEGWHAMRKGQLVEALLRTSRKAAAKNGRTNPRDSGTKSEAATSSRSGRNRLVADSGNLEGTPTPDGLDAEVADEHWVRLHWRISRGIVSRAESALGAEWHRAVPVIRVFDVTREGDAAERSRFVEDVPVAEHSSIGYVCLADTSRTYRFHVGFRAPEAEFFSLVRSRRFSFPKSGTSGRQRRITNGAAATPTLVRRSNGRVNGDRLPFQVEAELLVNGSTDPHAVVTLLGEPVDLNDDGSFSTRLTLEEGRQVIPAVSLSATGAEQRTVVLAIERNTKRLEPESFGDD